MFLHIATFSHIDAFLHLMLPRVSPLWLYRRGDTTAELLIRTVRNDGSDTRNANAKCDANAKCQCQMQMQTSGNWVIPLIVIKQSHDTRLL